MLLTIQTAQRFDALKVQLISTQESILISTPEEILHFPVRSPAVLIYCRIHLFSPSCSCGRIQYQVILVWEPSELSVNWMRMEPLQGGRNMSLLCPNWKQDVCACPTYTPAWGCHGLKSQVGTRQGSALMDALLALASGLFSSIWYKYSLQEGITVMFLLGQK